MKKYPDWEIPRPQVEIDQEKRDLVQLEIRDYAAQIAAYVKYLTWFIFIIVGILIFKGDL